jgi:hypothetical protein
MDGMRDLGSFGDERLKKGALISSLPWSISGLAVSGSWASDEAAKCDLAGFCTILR